MEVKQHITVMDSGLTILKQTMLSVAAPRSTGLLWVRSASLCTALSGVRTGTSARLCLLNNHFVTRRGSGEHLVPPEFFYNHRDLICAFSAIRGGTSNNRAHVGAFYVNLNNTVGNANWNIGTSQSYNNLMQIIFLTNV